MAEYSRQVDAKWQRRWAETGLYSFDPDRVDEKLYCLSMFSYPSGAKLHIGHWWNYGLTDSWARMKRLQGYEVFEPMGFDAFGLPAENYAIDTGIHPRESTMTNIDTMRKQLQAMGAMFDWDYEVVTCEPGYYRWTQWLFLQLYRAGLAYRAKSPVNWCPGCNTVLANEQVHDGSCERCDAEVRQKNMTQWFFKITEYADDLLGGLDRLDWPEETKRMQRNWIGRSEGANIRFPLVGKQGEHIEAFTTRADTLFGATYLVLAPEHPLVDVLTTEKQKEEVIAYRDYAASKSERERLATEREKTGVFTGGYAEHPLTGEHLQVWIADYVLLSYGTGAIMAVPGHDERDFEFAEKFDLPIPRVIAAREDDIDDSLPYTGEGVMQNSKEFSGLTSSDGRQEVVGTLEEQGLGEETISYRLRDWLVSRQRYWGAPIPVVHCPHCGVVPVPEEQLPLTLPDEVDFTPEGTSPLAQCEEFMQTECPECGHKARRDPDTLDTFVDSSWYFLRYPDNRNEEEPFDSGWIDRMLPVDQYVGGAEHAVMHLLYARFITRVLFDLGYVNFTEPFEALVHQGVILGPDGYKMSKSRGNIVSPDDYVEEYGSDVFRLYLAFGFNYVEGGAWDDAGIQATRRFLDRVERWVNRLQTLLSNRPGSGSPQRSEITEELEYYWHNGIRKATEDAEVFQFNTAVARMMELTNALYKYDTEIPDQEKDIQLLENATRDLLLLLAPFAPHFAEEMWEIFGGEYSIFDQQWPEHDPQKLVQSEIEIAVQVNGRVRDTICIPPDASEEEIREIAESSERVQKYLTGEIKKTIVVPGRLINFVV